MSLEAIIGHTRMGVNFVGGGATRHQYILMTGLQWTDAFLGLAFFAVCTLSFIPRPVPGARKRKNNRNCAL